MTGLKPLNSVDTSELARNIARVALGPVTLLVAFGSGGAPHETEGWMVLDGLLGTLLWAIVLAVVRVSLWTVLELLLIASVVGMIVLAITIGPRP